MSADGPRTTLTDAEVSQLATDLYQARQTGVAIPPLTDERPGLTMADGYRIQQELVSRLARSPSAASRATSSCWIR